MLTNDYIFTNVFFNFTDMTARQCQNLSPVIWVVSRGGYGFGSVITPVHCAITRRIVLRINSLVFARVTSDAPETFVVIHFDPFVGTAVTFWGFARAFRDHVGSPVPAPRPAGGLPPLGSHSGHTGTHRLPGVHEQPGCQQAHV